MCRNDGGRGTFCDFMQMNTGTVFRCWVQPGVCQHPHPSFGVGQSQKKYGWKRAQQMATRFQLGLQTALVRVSGDPNKALPIQLASLSGIHLFALLGLCSGPSTPQTSTSGSSLRLSCCRQTSPGKSAESQQRNNMAPLSLSCCLQASELLDRRIVS